MEKQSILDFEAARRRRDEGAARAAEHADRVVDPKWQQKAYDFLLKIVRGLDGQSFLAELVVAEAKAANFPAPPDGRAWGAVVQRAVRAGKIVKVGYAAASTSNCSPKVLWREAE
jgi:hypothetical protein